MNMIELIKEIQLEMEDTIQAFEGEEVDPESYLSFFHQNCLRSYKSDLELAQLLDGCSNHLQVQNCCESFNYSINRSLELNNEGLADWEIKEKLEFLALYLNPDLSNITLPSLSSDLDCHRFAGQILTLKKRTGFDVTTRGWCYILEGYGLNKGEFGKLSSLFSELRKRGYLPINICAEDNARKNEIKDSEDFNPSLDVTAPFCLLDEFEQQPTSKSHFNTLSSWSIQDPYALDIRYIVKPKYYLCLVTEKIDLVNLYEETCKKYGIGIANFKGWSDLNSRFKLIKCFKTWADQGVKPVLIYIGDFDPAGIHIKETLRKNFNDLGKVVSIPRFEIVQLGFDYDFIQANNFTWIDGLESGSGLDLANPNHKSYNTYNVAEYIRKYGKRKCESNVLVTNKAIAIKLLEDAIQPYLESEDNLEEYKTRKAEIDRLNREHRKVILETQLQRLKDNKDQLIQKVLNTVELSYLEAVEQLENEIRYL